MSHLSPPGRATHTVTIWFVRRKRFWYSRPGLQADQPWITPNANSIRARDQGPDFEAVVQMLAQILLTAEIPLCGRGLGCSGSNVVRGPLPISTVRSNRSSPKPDGPVNFELSR